MTATTPAEIAEALRALERVRIVGTDSLADWRRPFAGGEELRIGSGGVLQHDVDDQVVVVSGGASLQEVQQALAEKGQTIPIATSPHGRGGEGTIGGSLSMNLPHALQYACGNWRDWVLGLTVVRADGTIAKCGSKAVKNVAGYDVAKLFIGARGTLGVVAEVILRTYPLRALPDVDSGSSSQANWPSRGWLQRVLPTDFERARCAYGERLCGGFPALSVLCVSCEAEDSACRFEDDWLIGWGMGDRNVSIEDPTLRRLMERTKAVMDPTGKLNPGELS